MGQRGCNVVTASSDTLFLVVYSALRSQRGWVTVPLGGRERDSPWPCFGEKACLGFHLADREGPSRVTASEQAKRPPTSPLPEDLLSLGFQSLTFECAGSSNPLSL